MVSWISTGLDAVKAAVDDWRAMQHRVAETIDLINDHAQPVSPHEVRAVTDLLEWLSTGNFVLLGYREYRRAADSYASVPGTGLGILRGDQGDDADFQAFPQPGDDDLLVVTKDSRRSPVHRPAYLDYIGIRLFDGKGELVGERRFLGLFSATAYGETVWKIPILANKAHKLVDMFGLRPAEPRRVGDPAGHCHLSPRRALPGQPRRVVPGHLAGGPVQGPSPGQGVRAARHLWTVRLGAGVSAPLTVDTTEVREEIRQILLEELGGESLEHQARVSEGGSPGSSS